LIKTARWTANRANSIDIGAGQQWQRVNSDGQALAAWSSCGDKAHERAFEHQCPFLKTRVESHAGTLRRQFKTPSATSK